MQNKELKQIVADNIKKRRKEIKLSQCDVAEKCGWYQQAITKIESGKIDMRISTVEKLAEVLKIDICELFNSEE